VAPPPINPITSGLLALLRAQLPANVPIYDAIVPAEADFPYVFVIRIPGGVTAGPPLTDPDADPGIVYQVDCVGQRRDQAEMLRDRADAALLGRQPNGQLTHSINVGTGYVCCDRIRDDVIGGVEPEGLPPRTVYAAQQRYRIHVTPA
jgi:hypothetical protein